MVLPQPAPLIDAPPALPGFMPPVPMGPSLDDFVSELQSKIDKVEKEVEADSKPRYPAWLKMKGEGLNAYPVDYPKPDADEALAQARRVFGSFSDLRTRFTNDIKFLQ